MAEDGVINALDWDQLEDCGAYLRAPEPATLYRMHGNMTGAYRVPNLAVRNRVVVTNKTPSGLVRGFGGPQVYFALERLMQKIAVTLGLDPLDVIRRNLVDRFPYRCPAGAVLDSGDYHAAVEQAVSEGGLDALRHRRDQARAAGRLYGIGYAAVVEPSISNMGYITTVLSPEERQKAGPKGGAQAAATVALDPLGGVSAVIDSLPQGQGHRTVAARIIADVFGVAASAVRVEAALDTGRDAWSIAAGNYSSRFAGATAGAAYLAATRLKDKLARIAAAQLNLRPEEVRFADERVFAATNPGNALNFMRLAGLGHWSPGSLPDLGPDGDAAPLREPCSGAQRRCSRRTRPTRSTARPLMALSSISAASRSTAIRGRFASTDMSASTMPAACCTRHYSTVRCRAPSRWRSAPPSMNGLFTTKAAVFLPEALPIMPYQGRAWCPTSSCCTVRRSRRSPRSAPRGWRKGIR